MFPSSDKLWFSTIFSDVDEMENFYTTSIKKSLDEVAPFKEKKWKPKKHCLPEEIKKEKSKRDELYNLLERAKEQLENHQKRVISFRYDILWRMQI